MFSADGPEVRGRTWVSYVKKLERHKVQTNHGFTPSLLPPRFRIHRTQAAALTWQSLVEAWPPGAGVELGG